VSLTNREVYYFNELDKHLTDMRYLIRNLKCKQEERNYIFIAAHELKEYIGKIVAREIED